MIISIITATINIHKTIKIKLIKIITVNYNLKKCSEVLFTSFLVPSSVQHESTVFPGCKHLKLKNICDPSESPVPSSWQQPVLPSAAVLFVVSSTQFQEKMCGEFLFC